MMTSFVNEISGDWRDQDKQMFGWLEQMKNFYGRKFA